MESNPGSEDSGPRHHPSHLAAAAAAICYAILHALLEARQPSLLPPAEGLEQLWRIPVSLGVFAVLPLLAWTVSRWQASRFTELGIAPGPQERRAGALAFLVFALALVAAAVDRPRTAWTVLAVILWAVCQFLIAVRADARRHGQRLTGRIEFLAFLFFLSGFSALIYQIVWQRLLFTAFGVDADSVVVIVSVFMLGLGCGSLLGAWLLRFRARLLQIFLVIEVGIGAFGLCSTLVAETVRTHVEAGGLVTLALASYALFGLPTLLMGATLPVLVGFLHQRYRDIGRSTGLLYAANTLGSAVSAFVTVTVIFVFMGQRSATYLAAGLNLLTAVWIYRAVRGVAPFPASAERLPAPSSAPLPYRSALLLAFVLGFIALGQELVWFRLLGFVSGGRPQVFGLVLAAMLTGIALGSLRATRHATRGDARSVLPGYLLAAAAVLFLAIPLVSGAAAVGGAVFAALLGYVLAGTVGWLTGGILPLLCSSAIGARDDSASVRMTWIYLANIAGAALGPWIVGYLMFDRFALEWNAVALAALLLATALVLAGPRERRLALVVCVPAALLAPWLHGGFAERIQFERFDAPRFVHRLDNRVSMVTVSAGQATADTPRIDTIYGGGVYDGAFNIDPVHAGNGIDRAFFAVALHPSPRRVLEIGLSSGSWAQVLASSTQIEELVSIEINPAYADVIRHYPDVAPVLANPKVHLVFDDGRRWLRLHPEETFDLIVMNTTMFWRSHATNLLSREFLELCRRHLRPGGAIYYNTTGSRDALYTAAQVFPHVVAYGSFAAASDRPFDLGAAGRRANLDSFVGPDGLPYLHATPARRETLERLVRAPLRDLTAELRAAAGLRTITDDNMLTEYKL